MTDDSLMTDPGLPNGTALSNDQFTITRRLSAGGFGITYLAEDTILGRTIVIKECFPEELCAREGNKVVARTPNKAKMFDSITDMFMHEARSLAKLRHPNIVGVHRAFEENNTAYMALDLIDGQDLFDIVEGNDSDLDSPERVKEILLQLLLAIDTIHKHDLLHRDISPDNIIIEKTGTPVLIDFGAARADASRRTRVVSSMIVVKDGYSPQEFYVAGSIQTPSSDLYALAATFYHVISGKAPPNSQIRMAEMVGQNPDPCAPLAGRVQGYDPDFLAAIDKAMAVVPRDRLQSAKEWHDLIADKALSADRASQAITTATPKGNTTDLGRMLTRIIEETNEEVEKSRPIEVEPTPVAVAKAPQTSRPSWADEFNEESLVEQEVSAPEQVVEVYEPNPEVVAEAEPAPVKRSATNTDYNQPNWALRVIERTEKSRLLELQALQAEEEAKENKAKKQPQGGSMFTLKEDFEISDEVFVSRGMLEPLAKYLVTGIVLGLASFVLFPNLL